MPKFGAKSLAHLNTVDPALQEICHIVVKDFDISIISGFRTEKEQNDLFHAKKSTLKWPNSKHNKNRGGGTELPSQAVDVIPYPVNWDDPKPFIFMAGMMFSAAYSVGVELRWGGNWDGDLVIIDDQSFDDLPHFELL
jgi:peptidoglycan L-alanyl-D-glutamate endopeptidase CwlK